MATGVGERGVQIESWCDKNPGLRGDFFGNGSIEILAFGMFYCTGYLALLTSYAAFRIDKYCLHEDYPPWFVYRSFITRTTSMYYGITSFWEKWNNLFSRRVRQQ
jgi:hypothetical protein